MFKNPRRGRQARNFTTNVPKILDLKSSSEQIFSENCRWVPLSLLKLNSEYNCVVWFYIIVSSMSLFPEAFDLLFDVAHALSLLNLAMDRWLFQDGTHQEIE